MDRGRSAALRHKACHSSTWRRRFKSWARNHVTYSAWTPKVDIQLRATSDVFVYASASRGFKSGGFNPSWPTPDRRYSPEFAWSYEGGLKSSIAGGRVGANVAVFFNDYRNLQVQASIMPGLLDITNAASAHIRGMEIEGTAAAPGRIHMSGHLAWLNAAYRSYMAIGEGRVTRDAAGNRLNNAPEWSGSGTVRERSSPGSAQRSRCGATCRGKAACSSRRSTTTSERRKRTGSSTCVRESSSATAGGRSPSTRGTWGTVPT